MLLLLQEPHLTTLFDLLEMLASFKPPSGKMAVEDSESLRCEELHLHAENLSRRVWELLMLLPTCPNMLMAFQNISDEQVSSQNTFTSLEDDTVYISTGSI